MAGLLTIAIPIFGPFLIWGPIYAAVRRSPTRIDSLLKLIRVFRWVGYLAGVVLSLFWFVGTYADTHTGLRLWSFFGFFTFQLGLAFPESWLKSKRPRIDCSYRRRWLRSCQLKLSVATLGMLRERLWACNRRYFSNPVPACRWRRNVKVTSRPPLGNNSSAEASGNILLMRGVLIVSINRRMKTPLHAGPRFRVLLPLIMTGVQLVLLAASVVVHREPWVLPNPPESHAQSQSDCFGEGCVQFSPMPPEPRAGRILKIAMVVNFPAIFLGAVLHVIVVLIRLPHPPGEPTDIGFSVVFVPLIWYRIGRWIDTQSSDENKVNSASTLLGRAVVWFAFVVTMWAFIFERHHYGDRDRGQSVSLERLRPSRHDGDLLL